MKLPTDTNNTTGSDCPAAPCSASSIEEGELWELRQENRALKDQLRSLSKIHAKERRNIAESIDRRDRALLKIREALRPAASNRRFMQIAGPARECINLVNGILPNVQVDLPDTAAQDSASKSNSPAVSG